ncbi:unnamed protein product [Adineta steineri]|uniref:Uncharacterized protein n=1 Tax=Adineta steineri TaxID=433720 RepID=A0A815Q1N0_9BILA|nr:unnamed protein product [Adineta steineri]
MNSYYPFNSYNSYGGYMPFHNPYMYPSYFKAPRGTMRGRYFDPDEIRTQSAEYEIFEEEKYVGAKKVIDKILSTVLELMFIEIPNTAPF